MMLILANLILIIRLANIQYHLIALIFQTIGSILLYILF